MAAQHTPGPWHVEGFTNVIAGELPVALCRTVQGGADSEQAYQQQLANARLIAAAPDLLVALERLMDTQRGLNFQEWQQAVADGRAAIAKARGSQ